MSTTAAEGNGSELRLVWEPLEIGSTRVKNRIMMTAQTTLYGKDNILSDRHIEFFRERAKGGAALFITEQQAGHRIARARSSKAALPGKSVPSPSTPSSPMRCTSTARGNLSSSSAAACTTRAR